LPKDLHTGQHRVEPRHEVRLSDVNPNDTSGFEGKDENEQKESKKLNEKLRQLQEMLYAEHEQKVLVVLQAMDTGGKDGVINRVSKESIPKESASHTSRNLLLRNSIMVSCGGNTNKCPEREILRFSIEAITKAS
jgi:polyphosphate kinase 2 (PPK2 family)